ncbi:MAG: aminotransferase class V-fold PLP-dependent enzyme [Defluviitaleaceae bacterium]|nr:aminotransferase class V-fold PLP-dependent enzyme [Defluviitaleaceae bacterium]
MINLDYASHTPASEAVLEEFCRVERECAGNALSAHGLGRAAHAELTRATEGIASLLNVKPQEIIYTSGASEANNMAIKGIANAYAHMGKHILSSCLEHPSVSGTLTYLAEKGWEIELLKIQPNGKIDTTHLKSAIRPDTVLICTNAVDSELGAIQDFVFLTKSGQALQTCHMSGLFPLLHVDYAQAMGKVNLPLPGDFSTLCFSPHKFYGLGGFGVLVKREGVVLEPLIHGGTSSAQTLYRAGTPSPAHAAACYTALKIALADREKNLKTVQELREYVIKKLPDTVKINSPPDGSPYILNLSTDNIKGREMQSKLNDRGIAISVKSACSTDNAPSRPVFAITGEKKRALNSWRLSFSHLTKKQELDVFISEICYNADIKHQ